MIYLRIFIPLMILVPFVLAEPARAQSADTAQVREVELLDVGLLEGMVVDGRSINRLTDVRLRQGSTFLEARRAVEYVAAREYEFEGDVLIIDEGDTLSANRVFYEAGTKQGRAAGDVRLSDGEIEVFAPSGLYFVEEKRAEFLDGVRLVDSTAVITSQEGTYWTEEKRGVFSGDVELHEEASYASSDSLIVYRETEQSTARGDVFIRRYGSEGSEEGTVDSTVVTYLLGEEAFSDNLARFSRVTGNPVVVQIRADSSGAPLDTTAIRARTIEVTRTDTLDRLVGIDSVRIWRQHFAALGDSIVHDRRRLEDGIRETTMLLRSPVAWYEDNQIYGDTISVVAEEGSIDTLFVWGSAFVAQQDTALDAINQLSGRRLLGLFEHDSLRTMHVGPNARAIRYLADEEGNVAWAIRSSGDEVTFSFLSDQRTEVSFGRDTEGNAYPPDLIPTPFRLDGFRWEPELRPRLNEMVEFSRLEERLQQVNPVDPIARHDEDAD